MSIIQVSLHFFK